MYVCVEHVVSIDEREETFRCDGRVSELHGKRRGGRERRRVKKEIFNIHMYFVRLYKHLVLTMCLYDKTGIYLLLYSSKP